MDYAELLDQIAHRTGLTERAEIERVLADTAAAVASCLPVLDRERWASHLPSELQALWKVSTYRKAQSAEAVYAQIPAAARIPAPFAREHAQAVIRVLAHPLDSTDRELLARHLPDELGALVRDPRLSEGVIAHGHAHAGPEPRGRTLATGAAGSRHPISSAEPKPGQSGSVAEWDAHRMDRNLATASDEGPTDTLANHREAK
jgi:uncharacterized protein (DUF2267 family)